jgi:hypothetical protein
VCFRRLLCSISSEVLCFEEEGSIVERVLDRRNRTMSRISRVGWVLDRVQFTALPILAQELVRRGQDQMYTIRSC